MNVLIDFFSVALLLVFVQNLMFCGGYGASEVIRTAARPKQRVMFAVMIMYFSIFTSLICRLIWLAPIFKTADTVVAIVMFTVVLIVLYLFTAGIISRILKNSGWKQAEKDKLLRQVGVSAFNTIVLAVPLINKTAAFTISQSVGAGVGAGFAFMLSTYIVHDGMVKLENNDTIKGAYKGTPSLLIYIAIVSMAFMGFTGKSLFS